jgi:pilus assembly protein CpaE
MSGTTRIAVCDPNEGSREVLKKYLLGMDNIWLEADCSRYEFFSDIITQTNPDIGIINLDGDPDKGLQIVESVSQSQSGCALIVASSSSDGQLILRAVRAGAREFLNWPLQIEDLIAAMDRVTKSSQTGRKSKTGSIIAVAGTSGGVGTTSVAVNLACALAADPERSVVLVDLDVSLGDADVFLDTIPEYTLLDVTQNITRLDLSLLRKSLTKHETGVYLLPRPVQLQDMESITHDNFKRVISLLKASFSHLVIDLSKSYSKLDMTALQSADQILLLTQLDLPCLRNVVRLMMSFENYDGIVDKVKIVVNRSGMDKTQIGLKKAEETIGREIYWQIPNNFRVVSECRNNGAPLVTIAPKENITQNIAELADKLCGNGVPETSANAEGDKQKKSWLSFMKK